MLSRLISRDNIASALDDLMLRVETRKYIVGRPGRMYQPLPWIGISDARRAAGTYDRMQAMRGFLGSRKEPTGVVLDVGCNTGFFSLSLMEDGYFVYGVDSQERNLRIAAAVSRRIAGVGGFVPVRMKCDRQTVGYLPSADVTIVLSIWHHWVKHYGLDSATDILSTLWERTRSVLFFDSGEAEMPESYRLPYGSTDAREWLASYLANNCQGAYVVHLGRFSAAAPEGSRIDGPISRSLFAVARPQG